MSTVGLYISYIIPIYLGWRVRRTNGWDEQGPWHLGRYSNLVNIVAMAWTGFICAILVMPPNQVAGETMLGIGTILAIWYFARERQRFTAAAVLSAAYLLPRSVA